MSNKIVKTDRKKDSAGAGIQVTEQIIEYLLAIVSVILCTAVPLYASEGYHQIGKAKFAAYRVVMAGGGVFLLAAMIPYSIFWIKEHRRPRISVTDWFVLAYLILTGISVIFGGFYQDAWWGYTGWNMGLMSQISFVLLYLMLSRFGKYYHLVLTVLCAVAGIVYGIGILHRLLIDPIGFYEGLSYGQKAQFLSTLGQASWYGSFLAVTLPVGIGVFLHARQKGWLWAAGLFTTLGFCTLVTQNSDSAYFALAGALILLFVTVAGEREKTCRFTGVLALLFASGKIMGFLVRIRPNPELKADFVTKLMWDSRITWILLVVCLSATVLLYVMGIRSMGWRYPAEVIQKVGRMIPIAAGVAVIGIVLVISLQTRGALPQAVSDRLADVSYFNWDDTWGNGRGRIWRFSVKLFAEEEPVHKLLGVGPDCFHAYVEAHYNEEEELLWGTKQLTNAHNEWLNILINGGIFGAAAYLGIYVTQIRRLMHVHRQEVLAAGIAAAVVSYMCYNFFCYQQVLCTPFVFICMGIGEYILRSEKGKVWV